MSYSQRTDSHIFESLEHPTRIYPTILLPQHDEARARHPVYGVCEQLRIFDSRGKDEATHLLYILMYELSQTRAFRKPRQIADGG